LFYRIADMPLPASSAAQYQAAPHRIQNTCGPGCCMLRHLAGVRRGAALPDWRDRSDWRAPGRRSPYERPQPPLPAAIAQRRTATDINTYFLAPSPADQGVPTSSASDSPAWPANYGLEAAGLHRLFYRYETHKISQHIVARLKDPSFTATCVKNGRFDMSALQPYKVHGSQNEEIHHATGALISRMISARDAGGQPIIHRMISPMSGAGTYANFMRLMGFRKDVLVNDRNALATIAHAQCIARPREVMGEILHLMGEIRAIGEKYGLVFDADLSLQKTLFERMPANRREWMRFSSHPNVRAFQMNMHEHFHARLAQAAANSSGTRFIRNTPRVAALFYLLQNNAQYGTPVTHSSLVKDPLYQREFHIPVKFLIYSENRIFAMRRPMLADFIGSTIRAISHMHNPNELEGCTFFATGDAWSLMASERIGRHDFTVLSRYFGNLCEKSDAFFKNLDDFVVPSAERGGRFLITARSRPDIKKRFQLMGFETKESRGKKRQEYLLAYNFDPHSPELDLRPLRRLGSLASESPSRPAESRAGGFLRSARQNARCASMAGNSD
jgi:hypothetical protein